jgi:hypothetical protein
VKEVIAAQGLHHLWQFAPVVFREHGGTRKVIRQHIEPQAVAVYEFKLPFG